MVDKNASVDFTSVKKDSLNIQTHVIVSFRIQSYKLNFDMYFSNSRLFKSWFSIRKTLVKMFSLRARGQ